MVGIENTNLEKIQYKPSLQKENENTDPPDVPKNKRPDRETASSNLPQLEQIYSATKEVTEVKVKRIEFRKDVTVMFREEMQKREDLYKNLIDQYEKLRYENCLVTQEFSNFKEVHKKLLEENKKLKIKESSENNCVEIISRSLKKELITWKAELNTYYEKDDVELIISNIEKSLQDPNINTAEVVVKCINELKQLKIRQYISSLSKLQSEEPDSEKCIELKNETVSEEETLKKVKTDEDKLHKLGMSLCMLENNGLDLNLNISNEVQQCFRLENPMCQYEKQSCQINKRVSYKNQEVADVLENYTNLFGPLTNILLKLKDKNICICELKTIIKKLEVNNKNLAEILNLNGNFITGTCTSKSVTAISIAGTRSTGTSKYSIADISSENNNLCKYIKANNSKSVPVISCRKEVSNKNYVSCSSTTCKLKIPALKQKMSSGNLCKSSSQMKCSSADNYFTKTPDKIYNDKLEEKDGLIKDLKEVIDCLKERREKCSRCSDVETKLEHAQDLLKKTQQDKLALEDKNRQLEICNRELSNELSVVSSKISSLPKDSPYTLNIQNDMYDDPEQTFLQFSQELCYKQCLLVALESCVDQSNNILNECECEMKRLIDQNEFLKKQVENVDEIKMQNKQLENTKKELIEKLESQIPIKTEIARLTEKFANILKDVNQNDQILEAIKDNYASLKNIQPVMTTLCDDNTEQAKTCSQPMNKLVKCPLYSDKETIAEDPTKQSVYRDADACTECKSNVYREETQKRRRSCMKSTTTTEKKKMQLNTYTTAIFPHSDQSDFDENRHMSTQTAVSCNTRSLRTNKYIQTADVNLIPLCNENDKTFKSSLNPTVCEFADLKKSPIALKDFNHGISVSTYTEKTNTLLSPSESTYMSVLNTEIPKQTIKCEVLNPPSRKIKSATTSRSCSETCLSYYDTANDITVRQSPTNTHPSTCKLTRLPQVHSETNVSLQIKCNYGEEKVRNTDQLSKKQKKCKCKDKAQCTRYNCRFCSINLRANNINRSNSISLQYGETAPGNSKYTSDSENTSSYESYDKIERHLFEKDENIKHLQNEKVNLLVQVNNLHRAIQEMTRGNSDLKNGISILLNNVIGKLKVLTDSEPLKLEVLEALNSLRLSLSGQVACDFCNCMNVIKERYSAQNKNTNKNLKKMYSSCGSNSNTSSMNIEHIAELEVERDY